MVPDLIPLFAYPIPRVPQIVNVIPKLSRSEFFAACFRSFKGGKMFVGTQPAREIYRIMGLITSLKILWDILCIWNNGVTILPAKDRESIADSFCCEIKPFPNLIGTKSTPP